MGVAVAGEVEKQRGGSLIHGEDHTPGPGPRLTPALGRTGSEPQKLSHMRCHSHIDLPEHSKLSVSGLLACIRS